MEDPWGSPWTTAEHATSPQPHPNPTHSNPEPPPAVFISTTPANLTTPHSHSPWLDDDGFGDWASADTTQPAGGSGWGVWGTDGGHTSAAQLTPKYEPRRKTSSPQWPSSRSTSPAPKSHAASNGLASGQPSPDPWATEISFSKHGPEPVSALPHIPDLPQLPPRQMEITTEPTDTKPVSTHPPDQERRSPTSPEPQHDAASTVGDEYTYDDIRLEQTGSTSSRSSSPVSQTSEVDDGRSTVHAHSPITSVEDNGARPNAAERKASKVKELVQMYDGIALTKRAVTPERIPAPTRSLSQEPPSRQPPSSAGETPRQSGVEVDAEPGEVPPESEDMGHVDKEPGNDLAERSEAPHSPPHHEIFIDGPKLSDPAPATSPESTERGDNSYWPIHETFVIDMARLDDLVPDFSPEPFGAQEEVSDQIVGDSFTSISERKTWYRISRHEPLRKHNAGDDENYVRVTWPGSAVRLETIKIVRRWMEEDSIGGRTVRGVLSKGAGGNLFGWGSTATPVDLDTVFARPRSAQQATQVSKHRPNLSMDLTAPRAGGRAPPSSQTPNAPLPAHNGGEWQGLATFGWSAGPKLGQQGPAAVALGQPAAQLPPGIALPLARGQGQIAAPPSQKLAPKSGQSLSEEAIKSKDEDEDEDDGDDWGDMVSPAAAEANMSATAAGWNVQPVKQSRRLDTAPKHAVDLGAVNRPLDTGPPRGGMPQTEDGHDAASWAFVGTKSASVAKDNSASVGQYADTLPATARVQSTAAPLVERPASAATQSTPGTAVDDPRQDDAVRHIVLRLPDMAYMLR